MFLILFGVQGNPLLAQDPPPASGYGEVFFDRDDNNFHEDVAITLELIGVVFNEKGVYDINVDAQHDEASYYPAGRSLAGCSTPITLTTPGNSPRQITWESAANDDSRVPNYDYGTYFEYCPGMIGWGLYKVTLHSTDGDLVFYLNTTDGNWLDPSLGGGYDISFRVRQGWTGPPICHVYNWNSFSYTAVSNNSTVTYWDISTVDRGRDILERAWDYTQGANVPAPFAIELETDYPLEYPPCGIYIDYAKFDVNAELRASYMNVPVGKVFEFADWTDDQSQVQSTTITVLEDNTVRVDGELKLTGHEIEPDVYSVTLRGETADRGFWTGIKTSADALVTVNNAHILHAVKGVDLIDAAFLDADHMEIAEFDEYGVYQTDAKAKVRNARIHDGSIGVYATGACQGSYYGWNDDGPDLPVYVYNCDGHGFELVDLEDHVHTGGYLDQQMTFTIQFSEIYQNQLYGIWVRGTGSPLMNKNKIYENGRYGGQTPSHDGIHVNAGTVPSVHENTIYRNAYGFHHNDAGNAIGNVWSWNIDPDPKTLPWIFSNDIILGRNCFIENTINLGNNRNATNVFGLGPAGRYEFDGVMMKTGGSNVFADPVSGYQASNGTGYVYAEHNCWTPNFVVSGVIITNGDFANCATHYLPECATPPAPGGESVLFASMTGATQPSSPLIDYFNRNDWTSLKSEGLGILSTSTNAADISSAAILLARLRGITNDLSIEGYLNAFITRSASMALPISTRHAVLTSLLYIKLLEHNDVAALQICALIEQQCTGTELAKTGELFRGMVLGDMQGYHAAGVRVAEDMLSRNPADAEALALYYSLTHSYPTRTPKGVSSIPNSDIVLYRNYPNPFNPTTAFSFSVPEAMHVRLYVRDVNGSLVSTLLNGEVEAGITSVTFDASGLRSGVYFYTLETVKGSISHRMLLVK